MHPTAPRPPDTRLGPPRGQPWAGSRRAALAALAALTGSVGLAGCALERTVTVAAHPWIGYETLFLAQELGWLHQGCRIQQTADGLETQQALLGGQVQGGALTLDEVLRLRVQGLDLVVLLVFNVSAGADKVLARHPITDLREIRGLRIGVEMGGVGALMLQGLLDAAGLPLSSVQWVDAPASTQVQLWQEQRVDLLVCYEPTAGRLVQQGAHVVFDSRNLPDTIFDVLAATRDSVETHANGWRRMVQAHFRGLDHIRTHGQDALYRIATHQQTLPADIRLALRGVELPHWQANVAYLGGEQPRIQRVAADLAAIMLRHDLIHRPVPTERLTDARFVAAYRPEAP